MADKLTLTDLSNLTNQASAVATINANNDDVETAMDNTLSRDGTAPNAMEAELDMNDNQIINVPTCTQNQHAANKLYVDDQFALFEAEVQQDAEDAANSAAEALASASAASTSAATAGAYATDAADSAASAAASLDAFQNYYLGAFTSDPSLDNDGGPLTDGDLYFNTVSNELRIYHSGLWYAVPQQYLTDLLDVNLSSPADLDVLQYNTSSSNWINRTITGAGIQPLDADLTSWAAITRASGFDTFVATPSLANFGSLLTDEATGLITFMTTPTSANLGSLVTDDLFLLSDIELGAIAGLTSAADKGIYFTGSGTAALFDLSSAMRTFHTTPSSANLGALISDDLFLLSDIELGAIAGLTSAADKLPYFTGSGTAALADLSSAMRTFMTTPSSANFAAVVSDDAFSLSDAELGALAGLTSAADKLPYFTGSGTAALADLSSAMRTFLTTSSSANFKSVITDETGSGGALVFATGPTISGIILTGSPTAAGSTWTDLGSVTTIDINGGTVDGTVIGGASAAAATVTTLAVTQTLALQGDISPTSFSSQQNDYNPTNLSTSAVLRLTATAASDVTGLQGGADGRIVILHNIGSFNITLKDESSSSSAANRFALVADLLLQPDQVAMLQYDSTSSRWRAISGGGGAFTYASTAPASATPGDRWVDSDDLREYTYINDGDSSQWVELGPGGASVPIITKGYLYGLTLSNNGSDATNDIDIAVGEATDSTGYGVMKLTSGLTKQLDASFAAGTNHGGLDTGSIANTTYHVYLISNTIGDTVDVLFSTSATSPTMPSGYTLYRRIGSIVRTGAAIKAFHQYGDTFKWDTYVTDRNSTSAVASALLTITVPTGIVVQPIVQSDIQAGVSCVCTHAVGDANKGSADVTVTVALTGAGDSSDYEIGRLATGFFTNTSAQIYFAQTNTTGTPAGATFATQGWIDTRGRLA